MQIERASKEEGPGRGHREGPRGQETRRRGDTFSVTGTCHSRMRRLYVVEKAMMPYFLMFCRFLQRALLFVTFCGLLLKNVRLQIVFCELRCCMSVPSSARALSFSLSPAGLPGRASDCTPVAAASPCPGPPGQGECGVRLRLHPPPRVLRVAASYNGISLSAFPSLYPLVKPMGKYSSITYPVRPTRRHSPSLRSPILNTRQKFSWIKATTSSVWWQRTLRAHRHLPK